MRDITINGFHLPTIAKLAHEFERPITGKFAAFVWRLSNSTLLPKEMAIEFMEAAGYVPFQWYPLVRKNYVKTTPVD